MSGGEATRRCPSETDLSAFTSGRLEADERRAIESHVEQCLICRSTLDTALARTLMATSEPSKVRRGAGEQDADLEPGVHVERYDIRARIGAGAMGTVYEAYDPDLDRLVALKILKTDASRGTAGEELRQRLLREARAMARLSHPNVVAVYDVGTFGHQLFVAMELVRGTTLGGWLSKKQRTVREILGAYAHAGAGLAAAHDAGLVHRDFKPDNVLVGDDGRVRVTDFGLARAYLEGSGSPVLADSRPLIDSAGSDKLTQSGAVVGTPAYMSPEQFEGGETDARSDIFAFCVALYESLYGLRPFDGATVGELMKNTLAGRVSEPPRGTRVPAAVRRVLLRGLGVSREQRPASMRAMLEELARAERGARAWTLGLAAGGVLLAACLTALLVVRTHKGRVVSADGRRPVIAVLGFRPRAGDGGEDAWLGGAVARSLAAEIGAGDRARALSPDDLARKEVDGSLIDGKEPDPAAAARMRTEIGAPYLVLGTYDVEGASGARRVRIEARIVDGATGKTLREARQKRPLADLRELSIAVADELAEGLGLRELSGEERTTVRAALPANADAMRFYAGGLDRELAFDELGARVLLEKAVAVEPDAPMPHAALARTLQDLGYQDLAKNEARAALDHSSELARADRLSNEALVHELASEWDKAAEMQRALFTFFPDDLEYGLRLANALDRGGKASDARQTLEGLQSLATTASDHVRVNIAYARSLRFLDDPARAVAVAGRAAAAATAMGSPHLRALALHVEAVGHLKLNESDIASSEETEAVQLFTASGDRARAALAQQVLGEQAADRGDAERALKIFEDALASMRALGELHAAGGALGDLVILEKRREHYAAARERSGELAQIAFAGSPQERATHSANYAEILLLLGDLPGALSKNEEGLVVRRAVGDRRGIAISLTTASDIDFARGDLTEATRSVEEASALDLKDERVRAIVAMHLGLLALVRGQPEPAIAGVTAACGTHHKGHRLGDEAWCRGVEARLLLAAGKRAEAIAVLDGASSLLSTGSDLHAMRLFGIDDAYVRGLVGPAAPRADAVARLDPLIARAHEVGCIGDELDARLARSLLEIAAGHAPRESLASIAKEATERGFVHIAAQAKARVR